MGITKWVIGAILGVALMIFLICLAPFVLAYFLFDRSLDFIESFRAKKKPQKEESNFIGGLVATALKNKILKS